MQELTGEDFQGSNGTKNREHQRGSEGLCGGGTRAAGEAPGTPSASHSGGTGVQRSDTGCASQCRVISYGRSEDVGLGLKTFRSSEVPPWRQQWCVPVRKDQETSIQPETLNPPDSPALVTEPPLSFLMSLSRLDQLTRWGKVMSAVRGSEQPTGTATALHPLVNVVDGTLCKCAVCTLVQNDCSPALANTATWPHAATSPLW